MENSLIARSAAILSSNFIAILAAKDRHIIWANDAMHRIFGYEPGELIGRPTYILFTDQASHATFANEVEAAITKTAPYTGLHPRRRKDGSTGWFQINIDRLAEDPTIFVGSFSDESARKFALDELKAHQTVLQDQTEIISRFLPDRTFSFVNDVFCRLFGKSREELIGSSWQPVAHPDDLPMIDERLARLSPANPVVTIENRVLVASGEWRWYQFINRGLYDAEGCLQEVQSVGREITDLKMAERSLLENQDRLEMALSGSGMVLWDWDMQKRLVTPGHRWPDILSYTGQELGVSEDVWVSLIHPNDLDALTQKISSHLAGDTPRFESEHRLKHRDGHWVTVLAYGKVTLRDKEGKPIRMIGTVQDVSERKRLNEEGLTLLKRVEALIRGSSPRQNESSGALVNLTKRETQILGLIGDGLTSAQIAKKIGVATNTVTSHRQKMMAKLDLHSTAEVVRFALDNMTSRN